MPRIEKMFAFVVEDSGPEDEGVAGFMGPDGWMPMVGADMARVDSLMEMARNISTQTGKTIQVLEFSTRKLLKTIKPAKGE